MRPFELFQEYFKNDEIFNINFDINNFDGVNIDVKGNTGTKSLKLINSNFVTSFTKYKKDGYIATLIGHDTEMLFFITDDHVKNTVWDRMITNWKDTNNATSLKSDASFKSNT